jgi:hypothetical protein
VSLNSETVVVNGQRFTTPTWAAYSPSGYGPSTTGVPQVSPSMPPFLGGSPTNNAMVESVGGYGTAGNNALATSVAASNPWNLRVSPVLWAVFGLLLAIFLLRHVHWRDTILEGAEEHAVFGPASERASEEVS